jgi:hypothetical protein
MVHLLGGDMSAWFATYELALVAIAVFVSFAVAIVAFQIHRLTEKREPKLFGVAFLLFGISYLIELATNLSEYLHYKPDLINPDALCNNAIHFFGIQFHLAFFVAGLVTIIYLTFKVTRRAAYWFLLALAMIAIFLGSDNLQYIYLIPVALLVYISGYYANNFVRNKQGPHLLVCIAFFMFLAGSISYIFEKVDLVWFIVGHVLELLAMLLILVNLLIMVYLCNK